MDYEFLRAPIYSALAEVVHAVDYLQTGSFLNGVCLPVDGGRTAVF